MDLESCRYFPTGVLVGVHLQEKYPELARHNTTICTFVNSRSRTKLYSACTPRYVKTRQQSTRMSDTVEYIGKVHTQHVQSTENSDVFTVVRAHSASIFYRSKVNNVKSCELLWPLTCSVRFIFVSGKARSLGKFQSRWKIAFHLVEDVSWRRGVA